MAAAFPVLLPGVLAVVLLVGILLAFVALLALLAIYPASIVWAYRDARSRGKSGMALALLVALSPFLAFIAWPLSMLAWIVFRPEKKTAYQYIGRGAFASTAGHA